MSSSSPEIVRWYTRARRTPQLIGRTADGARIPGGPYTITQVVGAGVVLLVGARTTSWWASYGLLGNALVLAAVTAVTVWALGRIPIGSRNPLSIVSGLLRSVSEPPTGRVAGRPVRLGRPQQLRHRIVVQTAQLTFPAPALPAEMPTPPPVTGEAQPSASSAPLTTPPPVGSRRSALLLRRSVASRPAAAPTSPVLSNAAGSGVPVGSGGEPARPALTAVQALLASTSTSSRSPEPSRSPVAVLTRPTSRKDR